MTIVLVDAGPLVALLTRRDRRHDWVREYLDSIEPPMFTCEPVLSEVCFLLREVHGGAESLLSLVQKGVLECNLRIQLEAEHIRNLLLKYADQPISLADACLVRMSELIPDSVVMTFDSDFLTYRRYQRQVIPTAMPPLG